MKGTAILVITDYDGFLGNNVLLLLSLSIVHVEHYTTVPIMQKHFTVFIVLAFTTTFQGRATYRIILARNFHFSDTSDHSVTIVTFIAAFSPSLLMT